MDAFALASAVIATFSRHCGVQDRYCSIIRASSVLSCISWFPFEPVPRKSEKPSSESAVQPYSLHMAIRLSALGDVLPDS